MNERQVLQTLRAEMHAELTGRILPYWTVTAADPRNGGFIGLITEEGVADIAAPKGGILNARILWAFSAAHRVLGGDTCREAAERAADFFWSRFLDRTHGGIYWAVDAAGPPHDTRKHVYAQAFGVYALSEHYRATGQVSSRDEAVAIFHLLDRHAYDHEQGGYHEAFDREWRLLDDVRLSEKDANESKSMNTHLHLLEAFTTLYRAWPDPHLRHRLRELLELFPDRIIDPDGRTARPFFDACWRPTSETVSFGHDIEASWLLEEAADALADPQLGARVRAAALGLADAVREQGTDADGGLFYAAGPGLELDTDKEWWVQAEGIVGFLNAYQSSSRCTFLDAAKRAWEFVRDHQRDLVGGEWHRRVDRHGVPRPGFEKVGPWKCPYHNARACLEVMTRVDSIEASGTRMGVRQ
jgi:cellobiose epimerase